MTKFGVRLLALFFIFWAFSDVYGLITGTRTQHGFMVLYASLNKAGIDSGFDILGWIGVWIFLSTGYQLWRFDNGGRIWALIIFWPPIIAFAYYFFVVNALWRSNVEGWSGTLSYNGWSIPVAQPLGFLFLIGFAVFDLCVIYFLTRKKTKELFQKPLAQEANPQPIISQDSTHAQ